MWFRRVLTLFALFIEIFASGVAKAGVPGGRALLLSLVLTGVFSFVASSKAPFFQPVFAASAVAIDPSTGAYAYAYGAINEKEAKRRALNSCQKRNRNRCEVIASCSGGGYGWIYSYQRGGWAIGTSCGHASAGDANLAAKRNCNSRLTQGRCGVRQSWYDKVNDGHVPEKCKGQHPSYDPCFQKAPLK